MRPVLFHLLLAVVVFGGTANPALANRQHFFDIYGGVSLTGSDTVKGEDIAYFPTATASRHVSYDASYTVGGRFGWWFVENAGIALDGSYFRADSREIETSVIALSLLFMARLHFLADDRTGQGRLQPYLAIGPGFFGTDQYVDFRPDMPEPLDVNGGGVGIDARLGMRWLFTESVGLFTEYRLTHFKNRTDDEFHGLFRTTTTQRASSTLTTHHLLLGFSFAF